MTKINWCFITTWLVAQGETLKYYYFKLGDSGGKVNRHILVNFIGSDRSIIKVPANSAC